MTKSAVITNRRANYQYKLESDKIEAGLVLTGGEAKAVRTGHGDLSRSVVRIIGSEAWLINANIPVVGAKYEPTRTRKLLLHQAEILSLATKMRQRKLTLVPLKLYTRGHFIKLKIGLGKPKRKFEKRETIKKRDIERDIAKQLKGKQ
jgi:SsrA-binding protein